MTSHVLLNNIEHKDLKIIPEYSEKYGNNVNNVLIFPTEYADVQRDYPILFRKDRNTGEFFSVALLGFEKGENLFLENDKWHARYIPGVVAKGPFLIGFQEQKVDGELRKEPVIHIDMDDPRVNETEGESVFLPEGGHSRYLERISQILRGIREGMAVTRSMFSVFEHYELIEPVAIDVELHQDQNYELEGFYTIHSERLRELPGEALEKLNRSGFLQGAYLVATSLSNVNHLITMKREQLVREHAQSETG